jgi:hypothetical protein
MVAACKRGSLMLLAILLLADVNIFVRRLPSAEECGSLLIVQVEQVLKLPDLAGAAGRAESPVIMTATG